MKTLLPSQITAADAGFICAYENPDKTVTLYYPGDTLPSFAFTPAQLAAIQAQLDKEFADVNAARAYNKLKNMMQMSPAEIQAWVVANVTNLTQAQDAIATLATAVGILARRL